MNTICKKNLTAEEKGAVGRLVGTCNAYDRTEMGIYLGTEFGLYPEMNCFYLCYDDGVLVGFLSAAVEEESEADIKGCVLPERRREGIFRHLYGHAREELSRYNIKRVTLVSQKSFLAENDFMPAFCAEFDEEEYVMRYVSRELPTTPQQNAKVRRMQPDEIARAAEIWARAFEDEISYAANYVRVACENASQRAYAVLVEGTLVGVGCVDLSGGEGGFIYGLCVDPDQQRNRYGTRLLSEIVADLCTSGIREISLRVDSDNTKALPLYLSCGFEITSVVQYYSVLTLS